jgi:hypothetical protein
MPYVQQQQQQTPQNIAFAIRKNRNTIETLQELGRIGSNNSTLQQALDHFIVSPDTPNSIDMERQLNSAFEEEEKILFALSALHQAREAYLKSGQTAEYIRDHADEELIHHSLATAGGLQKGIGAISAELQSQSTWVAQEQAKAQQQQGQGKGGLFF